MRKFVLIIASLLTAAATWLQEETSILSGMLSSVHADDDGGIDSDRYDRDDRNDTDDRDERGDPSDDDSPRDPPGEWFSSDYEPNELVVIGLTALQVRQLEAEGFQVIETRALSHLGSTSLRLRAPLALDIRAALARVRSRGGVLDADLNHRYRPQTGTCRGPHCAARAMIGWPETSTCDSARITLGMIDTRIRRDHESLRGRDVQVLTARASDRSPSGSAHGTTVASLLVGAPEGPAPGLLPAARLLAVDAFHRSRGGHDEMDAFDFLAAMDLLLERGVRLINLSFSGPANALIARSVRAAAQTGALMVAAAGNDGPRSAPRYPAAYPEVLAVTALRADGTVYARASQGAHIDLGAPGVEIWAADGQARSAAAGRRFSGTSYAAPYVTAIAGALWAKTPSGAPLQIRQALLATARDLGPPGPDSMHGHGIVTAQKACGPPPAKRE